ncbi:MAG: DUF2953 domain-containing protein [Clostridiales bacterium]|nr:DUF2953 domain-containing protein [Roseburia sp.]MDD7637475.1 DUF2953 domain-containing protein [Clostridiales bacterium]MDY4112539.1 DUF2953 domain-containing protein [Roseburia sp.]
MSVILFILKLIGIILLALLGIILLLALLVLLVPVRYQVLGQVDDEITIHAKASWLLHLILFHADYQEKKFDSVLYIFGIHMKPKKKSVFEEEDLEEETDEEKDSGKVSAAVTGREARETSYVDEAVAVPQADVPAAEGVDIEHVHGGHQRRSLFNRIMTKIREFLSLVQSGIRSFFAQLHRIKVGIPQLLKNASDLKAVITDEANRNVILAVVAELKYLFGHFKFRKLVTDLRFSAGDPAATGQALGILSMFPVLYQYQVSVIPDFESEESYVKGTFEIKGRMRVIHFVASVIRLWKKKEVRIFAKKLLDR